MPARIWGAYMTSVLEKETIVPFRKPPPPQRESQLLYLADETCSVDIDLGLERGLMKFDLPCAMAQVDLENGVFLPHPEANCRITELSVTGVHRDEYLNCALVPSRNPVVTAKEPPNG